MKDDIVNQSISPQNLASPQKNCLLKLRDVSLQVPTLTTKSHMPKVSPMRIMAQFYGMSSGRIFETLLLNLNLTVNSGERIGLIGKNGAGKTTLLRLIAGIYKPSSGTIEMSGRAYGLFNIQLGMNAQATGIENIYLRGLQMGLTLAQIRASIEEVAEFTELGQSLNELFGNYSAGMKLRLAFAVSTILKPDILLMDEWIGSGDEVFKAKIAARMNEMVVDSKSLILASHNAPLLRRLCTHGLVMENGRIIFSGKVDEALENYDKHFKRKV